VAAESINRTKRQALVDGIKYRRLGKTADGSEIYAQELFEQKELTGYLTNMLNATKSIHEKVVYDSDTERSFAEDLEKNTAVKLYAKLPGWFTVPTPLGNYNPDWAVVVNADGTDRLYFVVETKSTLFDDALRDSEAAKIACGPTWARTRDLRINSPALYRLSYRGIEPTSISAIRHATLAGRASAARGRG
jgi:type III restriction enzyme